MSKLNTIMFYLWTVIILLTAFMASADMVTFEEGIYTNTVIMTFIMLSNYAKKNK